MADYLHCANENKAVSTPPPPPPPETCTAAWILVKWRIRPIGFYCIENNQEFLERERNLIKNQSVTLTLSRPNFRSLREKLSIPKRISDATVPLSYIATAAHIHKQTGIKISPDKQIRLYEGAAVKSGKTSRSMIQFSRGGVRRKKNPSTLSAIKSIWCRWMARRAQEYQSKLGWDYDYEIATIIWSWPIIGSKRIPIEENCE